MVLEVTLNRKKLDDGTNDIFWIVRWWHENSWSRKIVRSPAEYNAVMVRAIQDQIHGLTYEGPPPKPAHAADRAERVGIKMAAMASGQVDESISIAEIS